MPRARELRQCKGGAGVLLARRDGTSRPARCRQRRHPRTTNARRSAATHTNSTSSTYTPAPFTSASVAPPAECQRRPPESIVVLTDAYVGIVARHDEATRANTRHAHAATRGNQSAIRACSRYG